MTWLVDRASSVARPQRHDETKNFTSLFSSINDIASTIDKLEWIVGGRGDAVLDRIDDSLSDFAEVLEKMDFKMRTGDHSHLRESEKEYYEMGSSLSFILDGHSLSHLVTNHEVLDHFRNEFKSNPQKTKAKTA